MYSEGMYAGYNLSKYIRLSNEETLEFDAGDYFAGKTLPERIKYIVDAYKKLEEEVNRISYKSKCQAECLIAYDKKLVEAEFEIKRLRSSI
jgi:hypothetical protein